MTVVTELLYAMGVLLVPATAVAVIQGRILLAVGCAVGALCALDAFRRDRQKARRELLEFREPSRLARIQLAVREALEVVGSTPIVRFVSPRLSPVAIVLVGLMLGVVTGATGAWADPSPEELPPTVVAVVSHVPVDLGTITAVEFHHALVQAAAAEGRRSLPKPEGKNAEILRRIALEERLNNIWVRGQASEMRISVTPRQISRELARIKEENFRNGNDYRRFLKRNHYTRRDINESVELQLLATRIEGRVVAGAGRHRQDALEKFVAAYSKRWRARTVCAPEHLSDRCSNGPSPSHPR